MATALAELVERIRTKLHDWPIEDYITAAITSSDATMTVNTPTQVGSGRLLVFQDANQESVLTRSGTSNPITIKRGHRDSTAASHAINTTFLIEPQYTNHEIEDAVGHSVGLLAPEVYNVGTTTLTYSATTHPYYAAPSDFLFLISATHKDANTPPAYSRYGEGGLAIQIRNGLPAADFASGVAFYFPDGLYSIASASDDVLVTYAKRVESTTVAVGAMTDTVVWGAVGHLLTAKGVERALPFRPADPNSPGPTIPHISAREAKEYFQMGKARLYAERNATHPKATMWRRGSGG